MAILKSVNVKNAGRNRFLKAIDYVSNPCKNKNVNKVASEFFAKETFVNRYLMGKTRCKRCFKQIIFSLSKCWPEKHEERAQYEQKLNQLLHHCELYLMEQGYIVKGWSHYNTAHAHFHLLLETCNALTGKQFSQSKSDLAALKSFINLQLELIGFDEELLGAVKEISEEELLQEDDILFETNIGNEADEEYTDLAVTNDWNIGTLEQSLAPFNRSYRLRTMVSYAPESTTRMGREMVRVVSEEEKLRGREMVTIVNE